MQVRPPWWPPDILGFQICAAVKLQSTRRLDRLPLGPSWSSQLLHLLWVPFGCPAAGYFHSCLSSLWHLLVQHCLLPDPPSLPAHAAGGWAPLAWSPHWSGHRIWSLKAESGQLCITQRGQSGLFFFFFSFDGLHVCLGRRRVLERSITGSPVPHTCPPCVPFSWTLPQSVTASPGASTGMLPLYSSPFLFTSKEPTAPESTQGPLWNVAWLQASLLSLCYHLSLLSPVPPCLGPLPTCGKATFSQNQTVLHLCWKTSVADPLRSKLHCWPTNTLTLTVCFQSASCPTILSHHLHD